MNTKLYSNVCTWEMRNIPNLEIIQLVSNDLSVILWKEDYRLFKSRYIKIATSLPFDWSISCNHKSDVAVATCHDDVVVELLSRYSRVHIVRSSL